MADQALAARVLADPVVPLEGAKAEEPALVSAETPVPATTTEAPASTIARETTAPKANKRNSIFGGLFGKKEASSTATPTVSTAPNNESVPAVPAKDTEPVTTSPTVPQEEPAVSETHPAVDTAVPTTTTEAAPATTSATSPVTPDTSKTNRRTSFFSNLGTKKEKRSGGVSDAEGTDGEGKKSGGFGGLLRKASRAQGSRSASKPAPTSTTNGVSETETPAPISKDAPTETTTLGEASHEPTTTAPQQTPVQATA